MAVTCTKRPLWWYIGSGVTIAIGLALFILGILAKTSGTTQLYSGLSTAPYIDNTYETEGCKNLFLGDSTCPGARFQGWNMTSVEKYNTCMLDSSPSSKALASASKWCKDGHGGCTKPGSCQPGAKYIYSFFSVLNADEVLKGYPAEVKEMEPIHMRKRSDRVNVDKAQWDKDSVAQWSETVDWELMNPDTDQYLLDQVIVVPNPAAFMSFAPSLLGSTSRISYEQFAFTIAAGKFYGGLQASVDVVAAKYGSGMKMIFNGDSAINWATLIRDAYWNGSPILTIGNVLANAPVCAMLMKVIVSSGILSGNADFFTTLMCNNAYQGNVALDGYSKVLEILGVRIAPDDAILFYSYDKGCPTKCEKPSYLCYQNVICPSGSPASCLTPSLSETDVNALFGLFYDIAKEDSMTNSTTMGRVGQFIEKCTIDGHVISPPELCTKVQTQLKRAGKAAMFKANPDSKQVMSTYGWTDASVASDMIPFFINGTVAEVMNIDNNGLANGLKLWSPVNATSVNLDLFTRQQVGSKFKQQGINYFKAAMGLPHSCAFDFGCMSQPSFLADGKTCTASDTCTPALPDGYDVGAIPGYIFGSEYGTSDFHGLGKNKTMFVSDLFVQANFTQVATDASWSNDVVVDKWNITAVGMRTENCADVDPANRGLDCTSPIGTINVGYNSMYLGGKTPLVGWMPLYMSFPYFELIVPDKDRDSSAYNPTDPSKLIFHACDSCPANSDDRDFNTYLWTDPQTGLHLNGNQRIQMNVRVTADPISVSANPANAAEIALAGPSQFVKTAVDVTIPLYWINKYDQAASFQLDSIAFVQSAPKLLNVVFWVGLWVGLLLLGAGAAMLWYGLKLRKNARFLSEQNLITIAAPDNKEDAASEDTLQRQAGEKV